MVSGSVPVAVPWSRPPARFGVTTRRYPTTVHKGQYRPHWRDVITLGDRWVAGLGACSGGLRPAPVRRHGGARCPAARFPDPAV